MESGFGAGFWGRRLTAIPFNEGLSLNFQPPMGRQQATHGVSSGLRDPQASQIPAWGDRELESGNLASWRSRLSRLWGSLQIQSAGLRPQPKCRRYYRGDQTLPDPTCNRID